MNQEAVLDRIDDILRRLKEEQSALENLPAQRDSAYQAYLDLEGLRASPPAIDAEVIARKITHASRIAWALYEALHQEYQQDLEWASNHPPARGLSQQIPFLLHPVPALYCSVTMPRQMPTKTDS